MEIPLPANEELRLDALRRYAILDTPPDPSFDRITRMAAKLLCAPIALIALVAEERQWFKSVVGLDVHETSRAVAFCTHTILQHGPLVIRDATQDPRFADNPLVTGPPGVRFYAGVPLRPREGFNIGTLSVVDFVPRELSAGELDILSDLASMASDELDLRLAFLELQRLDRERRESEGLREMVFSATDLGIAITDEHGVFIQVNPAYGRIFGYDPEELVGRPFAVMLHPKDLRRAERIYNAFFRRWTNSSGEWEARRKDGSRVCVYVTSRRLARQDGPPFAVTTITDLTEMRRMEEELRQTHKMDAVGRLAGGVAHDFNNLLTIILGYGNMLMDKLGPHPARATAAEIIKAAERAAGLTRRLLDFSRVHPLKTEVVDLNAILIDMEGMLRRVIEESVELVIATEPRVPGVRADRSQLEQIILNLAVNARDAMPTGGTLSIRTDVEMLGSERAAYFPDLPPGRYAALTVSDTGAGMSAAVRDRIFEPFFTTKQAGKGTGLGLATVYAIVKRSGGCITVSSRIGHGSTFRILLPEAPEARTRPAEPPVREQAAAGHLAVLVVDDDPALRGLIAQMLAARGHQVMEAGDARHAVELWQQRPDLRLLLTDVVMPGTGGFDLAKRIAASGRPCKVLFMSGYADPPAEAAGGLPVESAHIQKPFTSEQLGEAIERLMAKKAG